MQAPSVDRAPVPATDGARVAAVFEALGAVHVRGAVDVASVERVAAAFRHAIAGWNAMAAEGTLPSIHAAPQRRGFVPLPMLVGVDAVRELLTEPIAALARAYLGKEPVVHQSSHVREMPVDRFDAHLPYHQDETIVRRRVLNVWIPLTDCGRDAPGLEIVAQSCTQLLTPDPHPNAAHPVERARLRPNEIVETFGVEALWRPEFRRGDAMVFSGATVHRTFAHPLMVRSRLSVEMRLA